MLDLLGPMKIRDMHEAIDAFFDTDEDTEVGDVAHRPLDDAADWIFVFGRLPRIRHDLFETERDAAVPRVDVQDDNFYLLPNLKKF